MKGRSMSRTVSVAITAAALSTMLGAGVRQGFGLYLGPVTAELEAGREIYGMAMAVGNLIYGVPLIGILADRFGARLVLAVGGLIYALGLALMTVWLTVPGLILSIGLLVGIGLGATTFVVVLGAVGKLVPESQRSRVFGVITATGSVGFLIMPPITQALIDDFGWKTAVLAQAGMVLLIVPLATCLPGGGRLRRKKNQDAFVAEIPIWTYIREGFKKPSYIMLVVGFFVCGFHVSFISVHLPVYLEDNGIGQIRGVALALIGAFNLVGSLTFGWLGDRLPRRFLLSFIYGGRGLVLAAYFLTPITVTSTLLFSVLMGMLWLATVPLTSGTVARFFGTRYLATMYGFVFFGHQVGAFFGAWWSGRVYDLVGSYDLMFYLAIALGVFGFLVHLPIREEPIRMRLDPAEPASTPAA